MSTECHIMAIGKYCEEVREYLDYPAEWYENCAEGESVVTGTLFRRSAKSEVLDLAEKLDICAYSPDKWWLPNDRMWLSVWCEYIKSLPDWDSERKALLAFLGAGFDFMFMLEA